MSEITVGLLQLDVVQEKAKNVITAATMAKEAVAKGAQILCLPEMFCCPYTNKSFVANQEPKGEMVYTALQKIAADNHVLLIGGSMPEKEGDKIFNTCFIFDKNGNQIGRHRKMHLFDIDVEGGQHFKESATFTAGKDVTVIPTEFGTIGVQICFDIRFIELARLMALKGAEMIFTPAAFNMTTGPAHWELSWRGRAMDNQVFSFGCSPARDPKGEYVAWGHSIAVDPWGTVLNMLDEKKGILLQKIDMARVKAVREQLPILKNRRKDIYEVRLK